MGGFGLPMVSKLVAEPIPVIGRKLTAPTDDTPGSGELSR
jgi:hypothetical protein